MALNGLVFCMTGTLTEPRAKITALIEKNGGEVKKTVTKQVHFLEPSFLSFLLINYKYLNLDR